MMMPGGSLFITTDAVGGVWSYSVALARGLAAGGQPCILAVLGPPPNAAQRIEASRAEGCSLIETGLPLEWTLGGRAELDTMVAAVIAMAMRLGATAAHLHAPALACQPWPMRVVATAHSCMASWWDAVHGGEPPPDIAWHAAATRQGMLAADAVIAPSAAFATALQRVYRLARPPHVVHNGLPEPAFEQVERKPFVLAAGRLWDPAKNMEVLESAAAQLRIPIRVAGPVSAPGGGAVPFQALEVLGTLAPEQLSSAMAQTAIFVSPSLYEPFGLAVLEAAQRAAPLILADIPSFRELWSDAALFVPAGDAAAWVSAIVMLMNDAEFRTRLGIAASTRSRCYTQGRMVSDTAAIYRRLATRALCAA